MKRLLIATTCAVALVFSASTASALSVGDANYLGFVDPGSPASASDEVYYINFLLTLDPLEGPVLHDPPGPPVANHSFSREDSNLDCSLCPNATLVGADSNNAPSGSVDVTGWAYLLAKFGNISHVWYVGDLDGFVDVPLNATGGGQSHYSLYNPGTTTVPDGGATLGLLGLAMLGVGYLRRRMA